MIDPVPAMQVSLRLLPVPVLSFFSYSMAHFYSLMGINMSQSLCYCSEKDHILSYLLKHLFLFCFQQHIYSMGQHIK